MNQIINRIKKWKNTNQIGMKMLRYFMCVSVCRALLSMMMNHIRMLVRKNASRHNREFDLSFLTHIKSANDGTM